MGDNRTYQDCIAIRAANSKDAMTADWSKIPYEVFLQFHLELLMKLMEQSGI